MRITFLLTSKKAWVCLLLFALTQTTRAQKPDTVLIKNIVAEANNNSQLEPLAHELLDIIGPRLVGTPQMNKAADWVIAKFNSWNIPARTENWGTWRGWERGITHVDLIHPRVRTLEATQLAWSGSTAGKTITAETIILADLPDAAAFSKWLPSVKGKFVLVSALQPTGRPDYNWDEFGTNESIEKIRAERERVTEEWANRLKKIDVTPRSLAEALEKAGAAGIFSSYWSRAFGSNKIFGAQVKKIPTIDLALEDYGLLYRLTASGQKPKVNVRADSKELGVVPTFNVLAEIKGTEKPEEYVILSAHFDSWDGASGATDNGTGTLVMMEAARLLKKFYPNPKRTILVGLWGSEEQGLNGSRAFVEDHPEIVANLQAMFNQDNGTGRVVNIQGQGFLHSYEYINRWLSGVPEDIRKHIETSFPGTPGSGGSDFASFVAVGAPAFSLSSLSWSYGTYTWHTNKDTYDKIVFDDVRNNAILTAILAYVASEDPAKTSREKSILPAGRDGEPGKWPAQRKANRKGGQD
ncbi:MAG: M20/M25/M40 family metallo-hydrolase [Chitinophagaceae bacterium]|nr:M20/M25/M40 family metallo-hydrolase [Chitinophagaceae bacterium]MCW5926343.1 M20/M25/M40 family metallo-hydrolase [Chitinophagaceae bacterium]